MTADRLRNAGSVPAGDVPRLPFDAFRRTLLDAAAAGRRVASMFALSDARPAVLAAVLSDDTAGELALLSAEVEGAFPSLTPDVPQVHVFEREILERDGIVPSDHPWPKPVRRPNGGPPAADGFFRADGEGVHEVAVGPVHAGVIEPGHFRFQCEGERVIHLEIALGYQHRGAERALEAGPDRRSIHYAETVAGDTSVGHATAYARIREALCGVTPPPRAQALRAIALELERLANHAGDLGAMSGDVAFLPTASFCGRLRGEFLNLTAEICGSRFGRGLVRPGGVGFDLDAAEARAVRARLRRAGRELNEAVSLLWRSPSVMARFEGAGPISRETCTSLGVVGPAARASGLARDVRQDHRDGAYGRLDVAAAIEDGGDVLARARVRMSECEASLRLCEELLSDLPGGPRAVVCPAPAADRVAVALVEGWRGEICHTAWTGPDGRFRRYHIVDPSLRNWMALAIAMRDQPISDFPLCNKSFDLSYCGHDL